MKLLVAVVRQEWRQQWRSGRLKLGTAAFIGLCGLPPAVVYLLVRHVADHDLGAATYLGQTMILQPLASVLLAVLVAGNRSHAAAVAELWSPLSAAGLTNTGFLLRRWLGMLSVLLPLTLMPHLIAAGFALAAGHRTFDLSTWLATWAVLVLPLVVAVSAGWLAAVTITGSELGAVFLSYLGLGLGRGILNQILARFQMTLDGSRELWGVREIERWASWTVWYWTRPDHRSSHPGFAATEAPFDAAAAAAWMLPRTLLIVGSCLALLAVAGAFLGRTRRDLRPLTVGSRHPLRTYLELWNRLRQRRSPDAALGPIDRLMVVCGGVTLVAALGFLLQLQNGYRQLAGERFRAVTTTQEAAPLPMEAKPTRWRVGGSLATDGTARLEGSGGFRNERAAPLGELALTLDPSLEIEEMTIPGRRIEVHRAWDRLRLTVAPPLAPTEEMELRWRLRGVPRDVHFGLRRGPNWSFVRRFQQIQTARFPRDLVDFSRTLEHRALSPRRIELHPRHLGPIPRYTPWRLTPPTTSLDRYGQEVPEETVFPPADLTIDFRFPARWFLADTCGHTSRIENGEGLLQGRCRAAVSTFGVRGGMLVAIEASPGEVSDKVSEENHPSDLISVAALPAHLDHAENLLRSLTRVGGLSDRAWPGGASFGHLVVIEWPPVFQVDLRRGMRDSEMSPSREQLLDRLLLVPEPMMTRLTTPRGEDLMAQVLARDLLARRPLAESELPVFRSLFPALMLRRMGLAEGGAAVSGSPWISQLIRRPILEVDPDLPKYLLEVRLPAVLVEIESRAGSDHFYAAIETFLARQGAEPGTIRELLAEVEARAGISLERLYRDYFVGSELPSLSLEEVTSVRDGQRWRVSGKVHNTGTGEVICPVVVKSEIHELSASVTVDSQSATPFTLVVPTRPHTVLLDPGDTCHRYRTKASPTLERVDLLR